MIIDKSIQTIFYCKEGCSIELENDPSFKHSADDAKGIIRIRIFEEEMDDINIVIGVNSEGDFMSYAGAWLTIIQLRHLKSIIDNHLSKYDKD